MPIAAVTVGKLRCAAWSKQLTERISCICAHTQKCAQRRDLLVIAPLQIAISGDFRTLDGQFEQLYSWINVNNFSDVFPNLNTQDALIANRVAPAKGDPSFTIAVPNGNPIVIPSMTQLLVTRGTAYGLLPSMSTLRQLATAQ
jgi:hypothetical protein